MMVVTPGSDILCDGVVCGVCGIDGDDVCVYMLLLYYYCYCIIINAFCAFFW